MPEIAELLEPHLDYHYRGHKVVSKQASSFIVLLLLLTYKLKNNKSKSTQTQQKPDSKNPELWPLNDEYGTVKIRETQPATSSYYFEKILCWKNERLPLDKRHPFYVPHSTQISNRPLPAAQTLRSWCGIFARVAARTDFSVTRMQSTI